MSVFAVEAQSERTVFKSASFLVSNLMNTWFVSIKVEKQKKNTEKKGRSLGKYLKN